MGKPIYITETGIADAKDTLRAEWAESYFRAVGSCRLHVGFMQGCTDLAHALQVHRGQYLHVCRLQVSGTLLSTPLWF